MSYSDTDAPLLRATPALAPMVRLSLLSNVILPGMLLLLLLWPCLPGLAVATYNPVIE